MRKSLMITALLLSSALLSACGEHGNARQALGIDRQAPDAFAVSTHAPLAVPGQLNAPLPAPQPGAARPQDVSAQSMARSAVFDQAPAALPPAAGAAAPSAAEQAMLAKAGPAQADIRREVNRQAREDARSQTGPLDWLVFWRDQSQPGVAVDAKAEAERLARNRQAGQPVTAGATPVVQDTGRLSVPKEIQ